jgi:hypothetical protein
MFPRMAALVLYGALLLGCFPGAFGPQNAGPVGPGGSAPAVPSRSGEPAPAAPLAWGDAPAGRLASGRSDGGGCLAEGAPDCPPMTVCCAYGQVAPRATPGQCLSASLCFGTRR